MSQEESGKDRQILFLIVASVTHPCGTRYTHQQECICQKSDLLVSTGKHAWRACYSACRMCRMPPRTAIPNMTSPTAKSTGVFVLCRLPCPTRFHKWILG